TALGILALSLVAIFMGVVPLVYVLENLRDALQHSFAIQKELRALQERLEDLVRERTAELVEARDQAHAANRAKSAFLANMSHELRRTLSAILGYARLLQDDAVSQSQHDDLGIIINSGEHLLRLIDDVLDIARIEAGRRELEITPCDLDNIAHEVFDL